MEELIIDRWKKADIDFISTKACKEVEKNIKSRNLVIVAGHSGSGKSAIIQHIALQYRKQGWTVRRIKKVEDIVDVYSSRRFQKNKTICVLNDPLGKKYFDKILNNSLQRYEDEIKVYLNTAKLLMSCRNHIIFDTRVTGYLMNQSYILNIDDNKYKLSVEEKRQILNKYTSDMKLSDKDRDKIVEVERYFPLLCELFSSKEEYKHKGIEFFTEPATLLEEEILEFRKKDKGKYCVLALLVFFNNSFCVSDLSENKDNKNKFKQMLKLCELKKETLPSAIEVNFSSMEDCFVKKIGDTYHFYDNFVMEVTTYVFGTYHPAEAIKYADIGFLRRRVKLGKCEKHNDSFIVYLNDGYKEDLGERFLAELIGERIFNVVLNPCLRNQSVIKKMKEKISNPKYIEKLLETKKITVYKQDLDGTSENLLFMKLWFLNLENEVSPLFTLIVFCHTQVSRYCVNTLKQKQKCSLISAICCNGSIELFIDVLKDNGEKTLEKTWGGLYPIHIVSVFHNHELLIKLIRIGVNVNQKTEENGGWTPLIFAAGNDTQEYGDFNHKKKDRARRDKTVKTGFNDKIKDKALRDKTVQHLLSNGADINLCKEDGVSPLYIACKNGHVSTVQLLLRYRADINLRKTNGAGPLYVACQYGRDSTVQLLLSKGANINLRNKDRVSPLYIACQNGHDSTVKLLLRNKANINLCEKYGAGPLFIACQLGHDRIVQLLLRNKADFNLCDKNGASPLFIACQYGNDRTVQLLLSNGADINLCNKDRISPLYKACQLGHDRIVQLLLSNKADINLCMENGVGPFFIACQNGHNSTVQLLLRSGADINSFKINGASLLFVACQNRLDSTVQLLLSNGADVNLCDEVGTSALYIACQNGYNSTVQLLLRSGADINLCKNNGAGPLYVAYKNGHDSTVQLLLSNGADKSILLD